MVRGAVKSTSEHRKTAQEQEKERPLHAPLERAILMGTGGGPHLGERWNCTQESRDSVLERRCTSVKFACLRQPVCFVAFACRDKGLFLTGVERPQWRGAISIDFLR